MNLDQLQLAQQTLIPVLGAVSDLVSRLLAGTIGVAQARSELKGILSVAANRLDVADKTFAERDAEETARVAALTPHASNDEKKP